MKIVVAGGTGFLGAPLTRLLTESGHQVVTLSRTPGNRQLRPQQTVAWTPDGSTGVWAAEIDGADAVVNLAGEPIADKRWTREQKARILSSRLLATRSLVEAMRHAARPPAVFVTGSGVGYYGPHGDEIVTEQTAAGRDFLADVCVQWETEAAKAAAVARVVAIRTGLVLARDGGALPKMLPPFWIGAGGPVGSGRQYWPWIHRRDWLSLVRFAIETPAAQGALNATAPHPVTNAEFAEALGRAMHRPAFVPVPAFALKLLLGELAEGALLSGQRAVPARAEQLGFKFTFKNLPAALSDLFGR
jgi:uncharacterized protein (TIGR01777 family)